MVILFIHKQKVLQLSMYQHLTEFKTHAENIQISICFCKTCICLKVLENIHTCISVNMIDRLVITDKYSVKCVFYLEYSYFYRRKVRYVLQKNMILFIWPRVSE